MLELACQLAQVPQVEPQPAVAVSPCGELAARPGHLGAPPGAPAAPQAALRDELLHRHGPHESDPRQEPPALSKQLEKQGSG